MMNKNQASASREAVGRASWRRAIRVALLFWAAVALILLLWFAWQYIFATVTLHAVSCLGLVFFHALFSLTLERGLSASAVGQKQRCRAAFLISAALPILFASYSWLGIFLGFRNGIISLPFLEGLLAYFVAVGGALLGAIAASGIGGGYWENNSPPTDRVQSKVYQWHQQIIGAPDPPPWTKRSFDFTLALAGILLSFPVWTAITLLLWFEDPGPILFVKNSVGKGGKNFHQFKFRTMVCGAEDHSGPILSQMDDKRVLRCGRLLRKTALDELPQLINILKGEMSFVGPRPQRTVLVYGYLQDMPEYAERHRVLPGLAGLAQVVGDYYLTPRQKLRFDRLYIRYSSLGYDLKLMSLASLITFWFRWQDNWNGRLPRKLLRWGS